MESTVQLEIVTPKEIFYSGEVEMLIVKSEEGYEGFLPHHQWAVKLLTKEGRLKIREAGAPAGPAGLRTAEVRGGVVEIRDHFMVYVDEAKWVDGESGS